MSIVNFNKAKVLKTLKDNGQIKTKNQVKFFEIPVELREVGIEEIMTTDGSYITEEDLQTILKIAKEIKASESKS